MEKLISISFVFALLQVLSFSGLKAQNKSSKPKSLSEEYNLIPLHSKDTQYYKMESRVTKQSLDGSIIGVDVYDLYLRCVPAKGLSGKDEYTCLKFTVQLSDATGVSIPSLTNWKYYFSQTEDSIDNRGQLFGIDHAKFENLKDENGKLIPIENKYHVYNAFIDFHTMDFFVEKPDNGKGVQYLKYIGDTVVHSGSYSQPPVNLGEDVAKGSYFKNGKITLGFKGISSVNRKTCAIIDYDSGNSSFYMLVRAMPGMEVPTKGSSHYWGDIYKDLQSGWIQKATLREVVVSETTVPSLPNKVNNVVERNISIINVKQVNL